MRKTFYGNIGGAYEVELLPREEIEKRLDELALNKGDIIRKAYDAYAPGWRVDVWLDPTDGEVFTTTFSTGERLQRDAHLIHLFTLDPREMAEIGWRELLGEEEFEKARQEAEARDMDLEEYMTEVRGS